MMISIIVPVFNNENSLAASLDMLFRQTFNDIEIIAINDASEDNSGEILEKIATRESRIRVIHLSKNVGVHKARNAGLKQAGAPYVGFMDADDYVRPEMYSMLYEACEKNDADIAICGINHCRQDGKGLGSMSVFSKNMVKDSDIFYEFCQHEYGASSLCNKLYRRDLLLRHAWKDFRWRQDVSEDNLVNIGCFLEANRLALIKERLYFYIANPNSAMRRISRAAIFVQVFRAYAIAVDIYGDRGLGVLGGITELYGRKLRRSCYHFEALEHLAPFEHELAEAVRLIAEKYPQGLALLANHGWPSRCLNGKVAEAMLSSANLSQAILALSKVIFEKLMNHVRR